MANKTVEFKQKLYSWQKDLVDAVGASYGTGKMFFVKSVRQVSGKTHTLMVMLIKAALEKPGSKSLLVEPVNNQNDRVYNDITSAAKGLIKAANKQTKEITFINDSILYLKSAEAGDSIRGTTVTGICCVDEACYISDEYINTMLPVVTKFKAPLVFASSPAICSGFFYDKYTIGLQGNEKIKSYNWSTYIDEMYTKDELEFFKSTYSARKYRTEVLGEFISTDGSLFTNIENCIQDTTTYERLYFGIDWAVKGNDRTVVTCLNEKSEMIFVWMTNELTPTEQIEAIGKLVDKWKPNKITVEANSIGAVFMDLLNKRIGKKVTRFDTTNDSKKKIIEKLMNAFEQEKIKVVDNEELLLELRVYRAETTRTGKITYNAPSGYNDDAVMSLAICYDSINNKKGTYVMEYGTLRF